MKNITFNTDEQLTEAERQRHEQVEQAMQAVRELRDRYSTGDCQFTRDEMNERG